VLPALIGRRPRADRVRHTPLDSAIDAGTTFTIMETKDLLGEPLRPPFPNASRLCHNIPE